MPSHSQSNRSTSSVSSALPRQGGGGQLGPEERSEYSENPDWGDTPNPFSRVLAAGEPSARSRFVRAGKTLLVMLALTVVLMAGFSYGRQLWLAQLISGFDELDLAGQKNRLTRIAAFGSDAIEPLVDKLRSEDDAVAASAFTLLQRMQNEWITLPPDAAAAAHDRLLGAIAATFGPTQRSAQANASGSVQRTRASELLRQTIYEFSSAPAHPSGLLANAAELLAQLEGHVSLNPTLVDSPVKLGSRVNTHTVAKVVPTSSTVVQSGWTDWPPPASIQPAQIVHSGSQRKKLQAVPHGITVPLRPIMPRPAMAAGTPAMTVPTPGNRIVPVAANEELDTREVVEQPSDLAAEWKAAGPLERQQMADSLALTGQLEIEPWLTLLLNDPDRGVRLHVASHLEKTRRPTVLAALRNKLAHEKDPHVAARIRRILDLF